MKMQSRILFLAFCVISLMSYGLLTSFNTRPVAKLKTFFQTESLDVWEDFTAYKKGCMVQHYFNQSDLTIEKFNIVANGSNLIVHLNIQKTGSTYLEKELTRNIDISPWCNCTTTRLRDCKCFKKWESLVLVGNSVKRFPCGIHADWTVLTGCVERLMNKRHWRKLKQRHLYITTVRDPLRRYLSEWQVVAFHGAVWIKEKILCKGKAELIQRCFSGPNWRNVSLKDFMKCSSNLAINRMTRMLANLSIDNCYRNMSYEEKHFRMLASAKENLKAMAYFGLTGYQELSQILFENTFNLRFTVIHHTHLANTTLSGRARLNIAAEVEQEIIHMNRFDVMLYQFAKDLFFQRLGKLSQTTSSNTLRERIRTLTQPVSNQYIK